MAGVRERLDDSAARGRTFHQETWIIHSTETLGYQGVGLGGVDPAGGIQQAESLGWVLVESDHVFLPNRERSRVLTDSAFVHGNVMGVYLFRRAPESGK